MHLEDPQGNQVNKRGKGNVQFLGKLGILLLMTFTVSSSFEGVAFASGSITIDNDPCSLCSGTAWSDPGSTGDAYYHYTGQSSSNYSSDFRLANSPYSNYYYHWKASGTWTNQTYGYHFQAWLNNSMFNNQEAHYFLNGSYVGKINQQIAYPGWNDIVIGYQASSSTGFEIKVNSYDFAKSSGMTGADAIYWSW